VDNPWNQCGTLFPKQAFSESTVKKIEDFYKQAMMPELLGKWYTKITIMPPPIGTATTSTTQDNGSEEL